MARRSDDDVVEQLLARQRAHPSVDAVPIAAKIRDVSLFIGEAKAAQDAEFLQQHKIAHVVSLGTGRLSPASCDVLLVDILDMEDQLIVCHFNECIEFLRSALADGKSAVLVHCVYGQSRSAAVCVAYLMACKQMSMLEAYNAVQQARPCIYINLGFLSQLQLFERMEWDANLLGPTNAHAEQDNESIQVLCSY
ncbi:hypothetical protein Poli38472_010301 [Pythium oligandrum]|uniref:Protein-tyrosine-phosphatase n=1 Tax=Pythium oligandrum TaxID=41045 RepID=A0A8K1FGI6_PYTOL|nr:hypothetical protein Poli38472_010301 [Pythium oligandrum]|eukprot:TMW58742.1 hypothetical protein Poli38472_010301 [Pythium oligandrum]